MAPKRASETQKTVTYITGHNIGQRVEAPKPGQIMMASPKMATGFIRAVQPPQNIQRGIKLGKKSCRLEKVCRIIETWVKNPPKILSERILEKNFTLAK
jgi:hypothetical protein